ncbi:MAG: hypothetical protein P4M07_17170 [Xanthobacteraceae bacterium]|nr:hypothetical protein [Xanthobacteraceae bacterium]
MSDIFSVLSSAYASGAVSTTSKGKYVAVDPKAYEGTWSGSYTKNNKKFSLQISDVQGFRAQVKVHDSNGVSNQSVLIKNGSFRVGNTRFVLNGTGKATVATAVTDPVSGNVTLLKGAATQS